MGPVGVLVAQHVAAHAGVKVAGAVDVDPALAGRDVGDIIGLRRRLGVRVGTDVKAAVKAARPDVAVLSTVSTLQDVWATLEVLLRLKVPVITTTEELVYPTKATAALTKKIDAAARRARVAVLATGVNPGFMMDALPIALTSACAAVKSIEVERVQDARIRRLPFQRKVGAGLTMDEFQRQLAAGAIGHVGFAQSIAMLADALGWKLDRVTEEVVPRMSDADVSNGAIPVARGQVAGIVQHGIGYRKGKPLISLHMEAYVGAPETYDAIRISGTPPLSVRIDGIHGDVATAALVVNAIPRVLDADPGLRTMRDLELPSLFPG
jgi:4-hydroxy-tetrahydrodipicolinate reductase